MRANTSLYLAYNAYNYSTERIAKGDFIRMKEISLMYEFPKSWIAPAEISNLSLKLQATNLFLIYADKKVERAGPRICEHRRGGIPRSASVYPHPASGTVIVTPNREPRKNIR